MLGNFSYYNPTKLYFGENAIENLPGELEKYGPNVVLIYGGGSIKKNGIYDDVVSALEKAGKNVAEIPGVMPNPTSGKLREGIEIASKAVAEALLKKAHKVDSSSDIASVASISSGSAEIGKIISEAMEKVGKNGVINVDESKGFDTSL